MSDGTDLPQGLHKSRNDTGVESAFLPDSPKRWRYRFRRTQIFKNNMFGWKFLDRFADERDVEASDKGQSAPDRSVPS
jgi:hypothetical protein